jgi:hypothetical protein
MLIDECVAELPVDIARCGSEELAKRSNMVRGPFQIGLSNAQKDFPLQR